MYNKDIFKDLAPKDESKKSITLNSQQVEEVRSGLIDNFSNLNDQGLTKIIEILSAQPNQNQATSNFLGSVGSLLGGNSNALGGITGVVLGSLGNSQNNNNSLGGLGALAGAVLGGNSQSNTQNPLMNLIKTQLPSILKSLDPKTLISIVGALKNVDPSIVTKILGSVLK